MLEQVEWGEFRLWKLFDIQNTLSFNKDRLTEGNEFDYVTRTSLNQGILQSTWFVNSENLNESWVRSLWLLQMDFFYRRKQRYAWQFVRKIIPKFDLSNENILFFESILNSQKKKLLSVLVRNVDDTFRNAIVQLPVKNGKIDFEFIDKFVIELKRIYLKELEIKEEIELENYLQVAWLDSYELTNHEQNILKEFEEWRIQWRNFKIWWRNWLFDIATWRDVIIWKTIEWDIPLISHQHENNWITKRISLLLNRKLFNYKNTLSLADRWVFLASTQNENFHIWTRVKALTFKDWEKTLNKRLFYVVSINMLQALFTEYADNATDSLPELEIQLPTKNDFPDYEFMESFVSAVQKLVIKDVVIHNQERIKATAKIINN